MTIPKTAPVLLGLAAILLSACAERAPIASAPVSVTPTGNPPLRGVIGFEPTEVRTRKDKKEVTGVSCDIQGVGYTASVVTPALINLPDQKANSQPVTTTCTLDGEMRSTVSQPYSKTSASNRSSAAANGGMLGAAVSGFVEGVRDKSNDDWGYYNIQVSFD